jgi:UDP-glucose:(heptosyl)LPS alpha-1,3-glucosyltransferase
MNVALCFPGCSRRGGVERIMWEAARFLAPRHRVTVVAATVEDLPDTVAHAPVTVPRVPGPLRPLAFRRAAAPVLARTGAEVAAVYGAECPAGDVYVVNSVHRAWLAGAGPVEVAGRRLPGSLRLALPQHEVLLGLERTYYARARGQHLVPCARRVAEDLAVYYGLGRNPVTVVENGYSPAEFDPERRRSLRAAAREELGYAEHDVVACLVANEWQRKGLPTVLAALARPEAAGMRLLLAGRIDPAPLLDRAPPAVAARVRYVGSAADVGRVHAAADCLVMPTQYEAFSLAVIEALASGLPVVVSDVPGAADAVTDGHNGYLLSDPVDDAGLAVLLGRLADGPTRAALAAAAAPSVAPYRWDTLMARFEGVLTGPRPRPA